MQIPNWHLYFHDPEWMHLYNEKTVIFCGNSVGILCQFCEKEEVHVSTSLIPNFLGGFHQKHSLCISDGTCAECLACPASVVASRTAPVSYLATLMEGRWWHFAQRIVLTVVASYSSSSLPPTKLLENEDTIFMPAQAAFHRAYPHHFHTMAPKKRNSCF